MTLGEFLGNMHIATAVAVFSSDDVDDTFNYHCGRYFLSEATWPFVTAEDFYPKLPEEWLDREIIQLWPATPVEKTYKWVGENCYYGDFPQSVLRIVVESDEADDEFWDELASKREVNESDSDMAAIAFFDNMRKYLAKNPMPSWYRYLTKDSLLTLCELRSKYRRGFAFAIAVSVIFERGIKYTSGLPEDFDEFRKTLEELAENDKEKNDIEYHVIAKKIIDACGKKGMLALIEFMTYHGIG